MAKMRSKIGVAVILLISAFAFGFAAISGVFGSTQLGVALFSNPDLENGLVGHWTLDDIDPDSGTTTDRSTNGNDGIFITGGGSGAVAGPGDYIIRRNNASTTEIDSTGQFVGWDTEVASNGSSISYDSATMEFTVASGKYLIMWGERIDTDNAVQANNQRTEVQGYVYLNGSATTTAAGATYHRNADTTNCAGLDCQFENVLNGAGIIEIESDDTTLVTHLQRTDTTGGLHDMDRVAGWGGITILRLDDSWDYARYGLNVDTGAVDAFGNVVWDTTAEEDTGFSRSSGDITITDAGRYLVSYSIPWRTTSGGRSSFTHRLATSTGEIPGTRINSYTRNAEGTDDAVASYIGVIDFAASAVLNLETDMLDGTLGNNSMLAGSSIQILKLPAGNETFIAQATSGDIDTASVTEFTWAETAYIDTAGFRDTSPTDTIIEPEEDGDYLFFASMHSSGGTRRAATGRFSVNDTIITHGVGGQFIRNTTVDGGYSFGTMLNGLSQYDDVSLEVLGIAELTGSTPCDQCAMSGIRMDSLFTPSGGDTDATSSKARAGKVGQSLVFDGTDDEVSVGGATSLLTSTDYTLAAWIYVTDYSADQRAIFAKRTTAGSNGVVFRVETDGSLEAWNGNPAQEKHSAAGVIRENEWHHVVFVHDDSANDGSFYVDGVLVPNSQDDDTLGDYSVGSTPVVIGRRNEVAGVSDPFAGRIDDARIYDRTLSADEVQRLYEQSATTKISNTLTSNSELETNLVKHITFDGEYEVGTYEFGSGGATVTDPTSSGDGSSIVVAGDDKNVYVGGDCTGCGSHGTDAHFIYKMNPQNGNVIWSTTTDPTSSFDQLRDIALDENDDLYATGYCDGCGSQGGFSYYTYRINGSDGSMVWATTTDISSGFEDVAAIAVDAAGDVYVLGDCNGCGSFGSSAYYTLKIDGSDGAMLWATTTDLTSSFDNPWDIAAGSDGNVYVTGDCNGCGSNGGYAVFTMQVDASNGAVLWGTTTDPTNGSDSESAITVNSSDQVFVTATCTGCGTHGGNAHYTFRVNSSDGSMVWATTTDPTSGSDTPRGIDAAASNFVYVGGMCTGCGSQGNVAHYTYKVDVSDGSMVWATTTDPTSGTDSAPIVATNANGDLYASGECDACGPQGSEAFYTYKLDSSDGTMIDTTSSDAVIEFNGTERVSGAIGQGGKFDGVDDYIFVGDDTAGIDTFTWAAWINPETYGEGNEGEIMSRYNFKELRILDATGALRMYVDMSSTNAFSNTNETVPLNAWTHVAVTFDETGDDTARIYINGTEASYASQQAGSGTASGDTPDKFSIGAPDPALTSTRAFDGKIDDVRIYSSVLSEENIKRLYELGATTHINATIDSNDDLQNGLVGHWTFDGGDMDWASTSAESVDRSSNGYNGNVTMTADSVRTGRIGQSLYFNGSGDGVYTGTESSSLTDLANGDSTLAAWVKTNESDNNIFTNGGGDTAGELRLYIDSSSSAVRGRINTTGGNGDVTGTSNLIDEDWHHIAMVVEGSNIYVYANGVLENSGAISGTKTTAGEELIIGRGESFNLFAGRIDDARAYNRALSADEVRRLYELGN